VRKVLVIGPGGSGKSWLALRLSEALGLPIIHLDSLYWQPGWVPMPEADWVELQEREAAADAWIAEGLHDTTVHIWLDAADTVVFLDASPMASVWRVVRRRLAGEGGGGDVPAGCEPAPAHRALAKFLAYLWEYRSKTRAALLTELQRPRPGQRVIVLRRSREIRAFVDALPREIAAA
jgi:adenylate kinase family enzyme